MKASSILGQREHSRTVEDLEQHRTVNGREYGRIMRVNYILQQRTF